jgi:hypothetical protein
MKTPEEIEATIKAAMIFRVMQACRYAHEYGDKGRSLEDAKALFDDNDRWAENLIEYVKFNERNRSKPSWLHRLLRP